MTPRTVARRAPLSMGFPRQEHWSGLPCPPPGDLRYPRIEPCWGPAPVGSRDSLGRTALAKRITQQRNQRLDLTSLHGKLIKFVTLNLLWPRRPQALSRITEDTHPGHLLKWVLEAQASKWSQTAPTLPPFILKEEQRRKGEKRKQEWHGETKPDEHGPQLYFLK